MPWNAGTLVPAAAKPLKAYAAAAVVSSLTTMPEGRVPHAPSADTERMCAFAAPAPRCPPLAMTYMSVFAAGQLKLSENAPLALVVAFTPTCAAVTPADQMLTVAPTTAELPAFTIPVTVVEPTPPLEEEEPPDDEELLDEDVPPDEDELLDEEPPEDELLLDEEPPDEEDEEDEEELLDDGAPPPPPPPPHAARASDAQRARELKATLV